MFFIKAIRKVQENCDDFLKANKAMANMKCDQMERESLAQTILVQETQIQTLLREKDRLEKRNRGLKLNVAKAESRTREMEKKWKTEKYFADEAKKKREQFEALEKATREHLVSSEQQRMKLYNELLAYRASPEFETVISKEQMGEREGGSHSSRSRKVLERFGDEDMKWEVVTLSQFRKMCHSLGISKTESSFRNYFCAGLTPDPELDDLVEKGYMEKAFKGPEMGGWFYHLTSNGKTFVRSVVYFRDAVKESE